ncbi:hypothetical protein ACP4OV_028452 [Aristida adscensionis]
MPCFVRATSIELYVLNLSLALPPPGGGGGGGGEFPVLERLSIGSIHFDPIALISRCPRLCALKMRGCFSHETIMLHSATIEELDVHGGWDKFIRIIDINAPALKIKFTFRAHLDPDFSMSLLAPMVENHSWKCTFGIHEKAVAIDGMWCLDDVKLCTRENSCVLHLQIGRPRFFEVQAHHRNLQGMFQFRDFSVLELYLETRGHVYGATI